jgi:hypothetical protein
VGYSAGLGFLGYSVADTTDGNHSAPLVTCE